MSNTTSGPTWASLRAVALSPEGVPTDATCALAEPAVSPPGPDVIVNINADSTAAFSAWAMGSAGAGAPDAGASGCAAALAEQGVRRNIAAASFGSLAGGQPRLVGGASRHATWSDPLMTQPNCDACKLCTFSCGPECWQDTSTSADGGPSAESGALAAWAGADAGKAAGVAAGMTPSREITPQLRRRSTRGSLAAAAASVRDQHSV